MEVGANEQDQYSQDNASIIDELSKLWVDNVKWMRSLIMSVASQSSDLSDVLEQLQQNAENMASLLKPADSQLAVSFEELMLNQLRIGQALMNAFSSGDENAAEEHHNKWYENADKMAACLAELAPSCDEMTWLEKLYDILNLTEYEASQIMSKQFLESIAQYNTIEDRALSIAGSMAKGFMQLIQPAAEEPQGTGAEDEDEKAMPTMAVSADDEAMFTYPENLENALALIQKAVGGENEDRLFYTYLIDNSSSEEEKQIISGIRDNEIQHYGWFRQIYQDLTGKSVPKQPEEEFSAPANYCEGLARALMGEQSAVQRYRKILYAMQRRVHINMLTQIITDEIRHAILYSYLFTKAGCGTK